VKYPMSSAAQYAWDPLPLPHNLWTLSQQGKPQLNKKENLYSYTFYVPFTIRGWGSFLKPTVWIPPASHTLGTGCYVTKS